MKKVQKFLSNNPPKGTIDWLPEEFSVRKYIFDIWRKVCLQYGYEEYMTPLVEQADIYRIKSGEDVGGKELMAFQDRAGRELSIRPEMTPSVTRMVSRYYSSAQKPLRLFSIANFMRNEKPQRGRNREFWQLNFDIFGTESLSADVEVIQMGLEIMLAFNPPPDSFVLYLNNRKLIDDLFEIINIDPGKKLAVSRILDKWQKMSVDEIKYTFIEIGLTQVQVKQIQVFMCSKTIVELAEKLPELRDSKGMQETTKVIRELENSGYGKWIEFNPSIIRGFDYYDGIVFEVFDKNPENNRSMFGGGRYNGLAGMFGKDDFAAVGCAPGDESFKLFLESWGLLKSIKNKIKQVIYYIPLLSQEYVSETQKIASNLRSEGKSVIVGFEEQNLKAALGYADRRLFLYTVILGSDEFKKGVYKIKNMESGIEMPYKQS